MDEKELKHILDGKKRIHFIGIGGSGMFPLAQILLELGYYVTGSDNNMSDNIEYLRRFEVPIVMGHVSRTVLGADLIVRSSAIMDNNPELVGARLAGIPIIDRADLLALITTWYQSAICVTGTHGKTTTSAMICQIFSCTTHDFGAVLGGKLTSIKGSGKMGKSEYLVVEACEFKDNFLKLFPDISVILNIDEDHMEYFKTLDNLKKSFRTFAEKTTRCVIYNGDDKNTVDALKGLEDTRIIVKDGEEMEKPLFVRDGDTIIYREITKEEEEENRKKLQLVSFGWSHDNDYYPVIVARYFHGTRFRMYHKGKLLYDAVLNVPGDHNVLNAAAATAVADYVGIKPEVEIAAGIEIFRGAKRRFERVGIADDVTVVDDYAHHPTEIKATLKAAKALGYNRVIAVHQPFTYSRTATHLDEFAEALSMADISVITDIMGSREVNTYGITSADLVAKTPNAVLTPTFVECVNYLIEITEPYDLVITMGCGDIYKAARMLVEKLKERDAEKLRQRNLRMARLRAEREAEEERLAEEERKKKEAAEKEAAEKEASKKEEEN